MSALERRHATVLDVTANNVLFVDRSPMASVTSDIFDEVTSSLSVKAKTFDRVEEVSIEKFLSDVVPTAQTIEVLFENSHVPNLVSLIAPADPTAGPLFKWSNPYSWAYNGDLADSIKERVKQAGGNVSGDLCCRLAWWNHDDLDLHMIEPGGTKALGFSGGSHIYYGAKGPSSAGGRLDVDMNAGCGTTREPVENIYYGDKGRMKEGTYRLYVNQYHKRETDAIGFEVEVDFLGTVYRFAYDKPTRTSEDVTVVEFKYTHKDGVEIIKSLPSTQAVKSVWGLATQTFHRVRVAMLSPNHWDGHGVGNRHFFFMLDGAVNDGTARGLFNEFLKSELDPHRKAFELVGSKVRAAESGSDQLSGLGFSSTQRNSLIVRVKGSFTRTLKVMF